MATTEVTCLTLPTARYRPETRLVHSGTLRSQFGETSEALFLTQGFVYDTAEQCEARFKGDETGFLYSRFSNPNVSMFERRMIELEGAGAARATATGMAAVTTAILAPLKAGDHVVAAKAMFGSCRYVVEDLLPRYGIASTLVDGLDLDQWKQGDAAEHQELLSGKPDQPHAGRARHRRHRRDRACRRRAADRRQCVRDADLAEPAASSAPTWWCIPRPSTSTDKAAVSAASSCPRKQFIADHIHTFLRQTGPSMSPFNAWVLLKGLETLAIRVRAQTETAASVADALATHPKISRLIYPGRADHPQAALVKKQMRAGSTLVGFEVKGGKAAAFRMLNALKLSRISNNLGDAKSLVTHPATTTHQRLTPEARAELGISEGFVRFSAGLEHRDDLIEDFVAALEKA